MIPNGPSDSRIMIVTEYPSFEDAKIGTPLQGESGREFDKMLYEAKIARSQCFVTSVARVPCPGNDTEAWIPSKKKNITPTMVDLHGRRVAPLVKDGVELLKREIELVRPNVIVVLGNLALFALTGKMGITKWRGSEMQAELTTALDRPLKVIPTYVPNMVLRQWSWRPIVVHDLRKVNRESASPIITRPDYEFIIRPNYDTASSVLQQVLAKLDAATTPIKLSWDIETRTGHIACIGLAWSPLHAICIPLLCIERDDGYWTADEEARLVHLIYRVATHPMAGGLGQNFLYDAQYILRFWHFVPRITKDTMLQQHAIFTNMPKGLDFISSMYAEHHLYWKDEGKEWTKSMSEDELWAYNCKDACVTYEVSTAIENVASHMGLSQVDSFQQSLFMPVFRTMTRGIRIDHKEKSRLAEVLMGEIHQRELWLYNVLGRQVNFRSPPQVQALFYEELKQAPIFNRKTKTITTDEEALRKIAAREPLLKPLVNKILEIRSLGVFLSTFVLSRTDVDGRMRCSYNIAGTTTFRFSSSQNPFGSGLNLQNIPSGSDDEELELPNIRKLFLPDEGYEFFDIDLSSADLRIVAWDSDEPELKAMLRAGLDPYTEVAKEFYSDQSITKKDPRRQLFKSFCHGTHYMGTAKGLAERLGLLVAEAERTQAWYFGKFPRIKKWQEDLKDQIFKRRMIQNVFGHRYHIFDRITQDVLNECAAWKPQSTVAILINHAYRTIDQTLPEVQVLLQVHDSLGGQYKIQDRERLVPQIIKASEIPLPYKDPLVIPVGIKTSTESWGACG